MAPSELAKSMADAKAKEARVSGERLTVDLSYGEEPGGYSIFLGGSEYAAIHGRS